MSNFVYNRSKGRFVEFAERVEANDPANSAFIVAVINTSATDATLKDLDTMAAIEADANTAEVNNSGYARKTLANGTLTITYDDTNDWVDVIIADQTWNTVAATPDWTDLLLLYDSDTTAGDDTNVIPISQHDFSVSPDGSNITADAPTTGVVRAA